MSRQPLKFPPLECGAGRPVTYSWQLDRAEGTEGPPTNSITILSRPTMDIDWSGEHGREKFATVTLTRAEVAAFLKILEEDIEKMRKHCPDREFI